MSVHRVYIRLEIRQRKQKWPPLIGKANKDTIRVVDYLKGLLNYSQPIKNHRKVSFVFLFFAT